MRRLPPNKKKIVIGLTGSFGTGKSTVAAMMKSLGADVVDADELAHEALEPRSPAYKKIIALLGPGIVGARGRINRHKVAGIIFSDRKILNRVHALMHPEVIRRMKHNIKISTARIVVLDVPLLFEAGLQRLTDAVVVVTAPRAVQIARLRRELKMPEKDIAMRIQCQMPLREKVRLADAVIDNGGDIQQTRKNVVKLWDELIDPRMRGPITKGGMCGKVRHR